MLISRSSTGIGSLPHQNPSEAVKLVLRSFDIPFWPQLPRISVFEGMIAQFTEGMPQIRIDEDGTVWAHRDSEEELQRFYESYTDSTLLAISEDYAKGLHEFLKETRKGKYSVLKAQITGPITFTLGIKLRDGNPLYFDEELREIALMVLKAKARWQIEMLKSQTERILLFVDEPVLSVIGGSAYLSIAQEDVERLIQELVNSISEAGAIPGIHCCGSADWNMVIRTGVKVLSFDAYEHFSSVLAGAEALKEFLKAGGYLAWGIVPTTEAINKESLDSIKRRFLENIEALSKFVPEELMRKQMLLTPSCGMGSRTPEETHRVIQFLLRIKEEF
ncbi:MAG: hypothetical protein N2257_07365 [Thermodesulfovibrionales bacterium]|nr:hypothetical protein [Thermodesulfovibrionales bacterium]